MREVRKSYADMLGGDLAAAVKEFAAAVEAHRFTVGVPAPTAHPLVEEIVRQHGGSFTIVDDTPPEKPKEPEPPLPEPGPSEAERLVEALVREGIVPASKRAALLDAVKRRGASTAIGADPAVVLAP